MLKWLRVNSEGVAVLSPTGIRVDALVGYEAKLRQSLLDYIDVEQPPWLQNATFGRTRVVAFAGSQIAQVFVEAGLAQGYDDEVVEFWHALAARARGLRLDRLADIGRQGERLTLAFEEKRTGRKPKWVAVDNSADGYDVLSVVAAGDFRLLSIEVKASSQGLAGTFHLTRNEWERAQESECHVFHLWNVATKGPPMLAVVDPGELGFHLPRDNGSGSWESTQVPFSAFDDRFRLPEDVR